MLLQADDENSIKQNHFMFVTSAICIWNMASLSKSKQETKEKVDDTDSIHDLLRMCEPIQNKERVKDAVRTVLKEDIDLCDNESTLHKMRTSSENIMDVIGRDAIYVIAAFVPEALAAVSKEFNDAVQSIDYREAKQCKEHCQDITFIIDQQMTPLNDIEKRYKMKGPFSNMNQATASNEFAHYKNTTAVSGVMIFIKSGTYDLFGDDSAADLLFNDKDQFMTIQGKGRKKPILNIRVSGGIRCRNIHFKKMSFRGIYCGIRTQPAGLCVRLVGNCHFSHGDMQNLRIIAAEESEDDPVSFSAIIFKKIHQIILGDGAHVIYEHCSVADRILMRGDAGWPSDTDSD